MIFAGERRMRKVPCAPIERKVRAPEDFDALHECGLCGGSAFLGLPLKGAADGGARIGEAGRGGDHVGGNGRGVGGRG